MKNDLIQRSTVQAPQAPPQASTLEHHNVIPLSKSLEIPNNFDYRHLSTAITFYFTNRNDSLYKPSLLRTPNHFQFRRDHSNTRRRESNGS
ncbi:hypothetical protein E2C01_089715 [Portunus trituberculatus]|uniref:Uncharacterized protein n=1 Tax=Portunus trituberculatus TaxID=210409 RepID=A0A5B7J9K0_PORTR|nr:hypothetical protein [Portunus trituberculatus]